MSAMTPGQKNALDMAIDFYQEKRYDRLHLLLESFKTLRDKQKTTATALSLDMAAIEWEAEFQSKISDLTAIPLPDLEKLVRERRAAAAFSLSPIDARKIVVDVSPVKAKPVKDSMADMSNIVDMIAGMPDKDKAKPLELTNDQERAWTKLKAWLKSPRPYFVLKGVAGSGKSFLLKLLMDLDHNFRFTAPTNKAAGVLADFLESDTKTIYSLLGLRMTAEEDKMVLKHHSFPDLGNSPIIIIDEAGQVPKFMAEMIQDLAAKGWRFIFVGDPYQWNPINETASPVWRLAEKQDTVMMTEVKRFDNQLLKLSIKIRQAIKEKNFKRSPLRDDNDGNEGVFVLSQKEMLAEIRALSVDAWRTTKVVCWRNKTVAKYNRYIRKHLGLNGEYDVRDLILTAGPVTHGGEMVAFTDEEFQITSVNHRLISIEEGPIETTVLGLDGKFFSLYVPKNPEHLATILSERAAKASSAQGRDRKTLWASFWNLKNMFHAVRPAYALTSHRVQGSTLDNAFLDQEDMLANEDLLEGFRGLYVGSTRPRFKLMTF